MTKRIPDTTAISDRVDAATADAQARVGVYTMDSTRHFWTDALRKARKDGLQLPEAFVPRLLRSSFITAMRTAGADFEVLQAFIGHEPASVLSARYDRIDIERMKPIAELAEDLYRARRAFEITADDSSIDDALPH